MECFCFFILLAKKAAAGIDVCHNGPRHFADGFDDAYPVPPNDLRDKGVDGRRPHSNGFGPHCGPWEMAV